MTGPTPRQLAREQTLRRIKALALDQLAASGASELSLRAIARELNLVSSAIYRYYASRDDLITDLITDAYNDLADTVDAPTAGSRRTPARRWRDCCTALRDWARAEPHRFGLIFGTSIPGYRAPQDTVGPAVRVYGALCRSVADDVTDQPEVRGRQLRSQLATTADGLELAVDEPAMLGLVAAMARIIGMITLELGGHFVGSFQPADDIFAAVVEREAEQLGLTT